MHYFHVDVFSKTPLSGNGLTVVFVDKNMSTNKMQQITQEFRQFETIYLFTENHQEIKARIFTVQEELDFAGHPLLGAAAVMHSFDELNDQVNVNISLKDRIITLSSKRLNDYYNISMNQGIAQEIYNLTISEYNSIHPWFSMTKDQLDSDFPVSVVSTGLPYLLIPVKKDIDKVKISISNLEKKINKFGAKFVYFFDTTTLECRTWDNSGLFEDVATGSAAGPLVSYLVKNNFYKKMKI
jgi:PhzF family phenazine biosynthesis protein